MIVRLRGKIIEKNASTVVLDVGGVGYGLIVTNADHGKNYQGDDNVFYVYEHIRENAYDLYGFSLQDNKKLFEQLISVKNVGPKVAMAVLDTADTDTVRANIAAGEVKFLQTAKGVGRRAAEQIIVELRDKVGAVVTEGAEGIVNRAGVGLQDEAVEALMSLGYSAQDATIALEKVDKDLSVEERIKQALKGK